MFLPTVCPKRERLEKPHLKNYSCYDLNDPSMESIAFDKAVSDHIPKNLKVFENLGSGTEFRLFQILGLKRPKGLGHH